MDFIDRLLPQAGYYCTARLNPGGGFLHRFFNDLESLKTHLKAMDAQGHTMYLAQASFTTDANRKGDNAFLFRNFFLDIDCGEGKPYATQQLGAKALMEFSKAVGLTFPTLVSSGNGLYAHWLIDEDIPADKWRCIAQTLKKLCTAYKFQCDPVRTADRASVLRPVGTTNRKNGAEKHVKVHHESSAMPLKFFIEALTAAAKKAKVEPEGLLPPKPFQGLNNEFTSGIEGPPCSLVRAAEKCLQLREVRNRRGDVPEPVWYNFIGVARYSEEGLADEEIIHEWSQGHPDYTRELTDKKIRQHAGTGAGPTTCEKFGADAPEGCVGCKKSVAVKTPLTLGRPEPVALPLTAEEEEYLPFGYKRSFDGLYSVDEGEATKFYNYDLYPTKIAYDHSLGYETVTLRHNSFFDKGYKEFAIRSSLVNTDAKSLFTALGDNHVQVSGSEHRKTMAAYLDNFMAGLRAKRNLATLHTQMGWKDEGEDKIFVLGEEIFKKEAETEIAGFARNIPPVARAFSQKGDLVVWKRTTKVFGLQGMEPLAFAFCAGAFGAPLLRFTGYSGAMVGLVGKSGTGKSLVGRHIMSCYGDPKRLELLKDDTRNSLVARLGLYGSLPIYIDEVSNIEGQDLSDLLYRVTQGRDKARLHRSGIERDLINGWNTIAVVSSNHSLLDKLSGLKADASAEINRFMEIQVKPVGTYLTAGASGKSPANLVATAIEHNYGVAGPEYIKYLVDNQELHRERIDKIVADLDKRTGAKSDERFWSAVAGCAIYGGLIAKQLGLIEFQITPIISWLVGVITGLRGDKADLVVGQTDMLGRFMDDRLMNGLFVKAGDNKSLVSILREPRGSVEYRVEIDSQRLYIPRSIIKEWLNKHYGSYTELRYELTDVGALISTDKRMVLGKGTYISGTSVPCWTIDLSCPALGRQLLGLVKQVREESKDAALV